MTSAANTEYLFEMNPESNEWCPVPSRHVNREIPQSIYAPDNARTIHYAMTTRPIKYRNHLLSLFQLIYADHPENFVVTGDLHQNSMTDPLHLSVSVKGAFGIFTMLHINGYFRNYFHVQSITMEVEKDTRILLADFSIVE
jgi:hypothetical protein